MPEIKKVSPLLDTFALGKPFSDHFGVVCYPAIHSVSGEKFILKHVSIPESQTKVDALLLTGACFDRVAAQTYFEELAQGMVREIEMLKSLSQTRGFAPFYQYQLTKKEQNEVGMDLWLLSPYRTTLAGHIRRSAMTYLEAVNLGIDLCAALTLCRKAGYLYQNLRPENIYITPQRKFQLGDLGLLPLDEMPFAMLPDRYRSVYTPPELADAMAEPNATMDLYALGLVLYQIYNGGVLPISEQSPRTAQQELPPPAYGDEEMAKIIARAIAFDPEERWQSPEDMGQALVAYMQRNPVNDALIVPPAEQPEQENVPEEPVDEAEPGEAEQVPEPEAEVEPEADVAPDTEPEREMPETEDELQSVELGFIPTDPTLPETTGSGESRQSDEDADGASIDEEALADILNRAALFMDEQPEEAPSAHEATEQHELATDGKDGEPSLADEQDATAADDEDEDDDGFTIDLDMLQKSDDGEDEYDFEDEEALRRRRSRVKKLLIALAILAGLALAAFGGYQYYKNIYCVPVELFQIIDSGRDSLTVEVKTDGAEDKLVVSCQDTFGNTHPAALVDGKATFTGLQPNTQYMISLDVEGFHRLVGSTMVSYTTAIQTEIASFTAVTGAEDGTAILTFTPVGTEPKGWLLTYGTEGEEEKTISFAEHKVTVTGLTLGKTYTFTLSAESGDQGAAFYITGNDSISFTAMPVVTAENLVVTDYTTSALTLKWDAPGTAVAGWQVRCYNGAGYDTTVQTDTCGVVLEGLDASQPYTIEVTADGMTQSVMMAITANPVLVRDVSVDQQTAGVLTVSWNYTGNAPKNWLLMYSFGDDPSAAVAVQTEETSVTIEPALPGSTYVLQIKPADGSTAFNGDHTVTTKEAPALDAFGITGEKLTIATFPAPDEPDWETTDISLENMTDTFKPDDTIGFAVEIAGRYSYTRQEVQTLVIIRDAEGRPVDYTYGTAPWHTMWTNNKYLGELPRTPQTPGTYTLEIYFDRQLARTASFTVA